MLQFPACGIRNRKPCAISVHSDLRFSAVFFGERNLHLPRVAISLKRRRSFAKNQRKFIRASCGSGSVCPWQFVPYIWSDSAVPLCGSFAALLGRGRCTSVFAALLWKIVICHLQPSPFRCLFSSYGTCSAKWCVSMRDTSVCDFETTFLLQDLLLLCFGDFSGSPYPLNLGGGRFTPWVVVSEIPCFTVFGGAPP